MRPWRAFWGLSLAGASVILLGACLKLWQDPTTSTESNGRPKKEPEEGKSKDGVIRRNLDRIRVSDATPLPSNPSRHSQNYTCMQLLTSTKSVEFRNNQQRDRQTKFLKAAELQDDNEASVLSSKAMMPRPLSAAISRLSFSKLNPLPPGMFPRVSVMSHNESIPQGWPTLRTQWKSDLWGPRWNASALPSDLRAAQHARKTLLAEVCARYRRGGAPPVTLASTAHVSRLFVEERHRLLYCEIPKAGCTNWKRLLMVLSGHAPSTTAVLHTAAHYANGLRRLDSYPRREIERRLRTYTKVLFVREPLERLVSAFRDKLQRPNPYYGPLYGRAILARYRNNASRSALHSGTGVTFREFLRFLMDPHRPLAPDVHWEPAARLCHPCYITYDFIGHFEDLASEADAFLAALGIPPTLRFPPKEHDVTEAVRTEAMDLSRERGSFDISRQYFSRLLQRERQLAYDLYYLDYVMFNYSKPFSDVH